MEVKLPYMSLGRQASAQNGTEDQVKASALRFRLVGVVIISEGKLKAELDLPWWLGLINGTKATISRLAKVGQGAITLEA